MKSIHTIILLCGLLAASCAGNTKKSTNESAQVENTAQLETQLAQTTEPLEKFKLLDQIAREKAKTLSAEEFATYFTQFKEQVEGVMAEIYAQESAHQTDAETWKKQRGKIYTDAGLQYTMGEGMVYKVEPKEDYYLENFGSYLPQDYKDFFRIQKEEYNEGYNIIEDASLLISAEELAGLILLCEDFIQNYPDSKLIDEAKEKCQFYQNIYLHGIDNSPTKDGNGKLLPDAKAEFNRFVTAHPNSPTAQLAKGILGQ